jgi:hypothetical protein
MKITKRQLRRIIKEEKRKLLSEDRIRGLHSDTRYEDQAKKALTNMYEIMVQAIVDDGHMREEAEELSIQVVKDVFSEFLDSVGWLQQSGIR